MDATRLKQIPVFAGLSDEDLGHIATLAAEVSVPDGKELVREGDYSYDLMIIEEGNAEVRHDGQKIADLGPGDFFGEMGVLERDRRNADVVAASPMRLITLKSYDVKRMERTLPDAVEQLRDVISQRRNA